MNQRHKPFFDRVIARCDARIEAIDTRVAKFADEVKENPHHAFQRADGIMEGAGHHKVAHVIKSLAETAIERGTTPARFSKDVANYTIQSAKYIKQSTSQSSNFIDNATTAAWAQSLDGFNGLVRSGIK